jgi:uncharacterized membrane protein
MEDFEALQEIPLFSAMDAQEIASVCALMDRQIYAPGEVIMRQGEPGEHFYVIVQGEVRFSVQDAEGRELVIDEVGVGGFFGELSMLTGEPRSARVKAIGEVVTLALNRDEFFNFLQRQPHAAIDVLTVLGQRLHRTDTLLRQSVSRNVNELVEEQSTLTQRMADAIADFSGSMPFLIGNAIWFGAWILWNQPWFPGFDFDPFPFGLLTMIVSLEAIFLSIFVLISQNRQATKDRLAAEIDHQVNTKAEVEIGLVLHRLDDLEESLRFYKDEQRKLLRSISVSSTDNGQ